MPKYDYKCDGCNQVGEYEHPMAETMELHICGLCEEGLLHKVFQPQATHFKGQGWGKTYRIHPGSKNK
jgi:putative FmdB family regulatory protein